MQPVTRLTFSLSPQTAKDLTYISKKLGISRSGLVDGLLSTACVDMALVIDMLPETSPTTPEEVTEVAKRLRGASITVVNNRVQSLKDSLNDL